jgi:hypothetical protein
VSLSSLGFTKMSSGSLATSRALGFTKMPPGPLTASGSDGIFFQNPIDERDIIVIILATVTVAL